MKPIMGRIVFYLDHDKNPHPALILRARGWAADLLVHTSVEDQRRFGIPFGGPNGGPETWMWPPHVAETIG